MQAEEKKRLKARKAATKTGKPLFEEDGIKRGLLEKYDEEELDEGMQIDASGVVADEHSRRQQDIRAKLAAGAPDLHRVKSDALQSCERHIRSAHLRLCFLVIFDNVRLRLCC